MIRTRVAVLGGVAAACLSCALASPSARAQAVEDSGQGSLTILSSPNGNVHGNHYASGLDVSADIGIGAESVTPASTGNVADISLDAGALLNTTGDREPTFSFGGADGGELNSTLNDYFFGDSENTDGDFLRITSSASPIHRTPEPGSVVLLAGFGAALLTVRRRRPRRQPRTQGR